MCHDPMPHRYMARYAWSLPCGSRARDLTREYPPEVYGGAGVHVEFLARELRALADVDVHCFGAAGARRASAPRGPGGVGRRQRRPADARRRPARWPRTSRARDLVHSHTWYANLAGHLGEAAARRPARRDHALARAAAAVEGRAARRRLRLSSLGRAHRHRGRRRRHRRVSDGMRARRPRGLSRLDPARVHVVHNGIDTGRVRPRPRTDVVERLGVDPARPYASSSGGSPGRRGCGTCCAPPAT